MGNHAPRIPTVSSGSGKPGSVAARQTEEMVMFERHDYPPEWDEPEPTCRDCQWSDGEGRNRYRCRLTGVFITLQDDACERFEMVELEDC